MIDLLVQARTDRRLDEGGALARAGRVDEAILAAYSPSLFPQPRRKSLDRYDFFPGAGGAAVAGGRRRHPDRLRRPCRWRGGAGLPAAAAADRRLRRRAHNPVLLAAIRDRVAVPVSTAEDQGWRGDSIEAEAFAYLAARTARGPLPISFQGRPGFRSR